MKKWWFWRDIAQILANQTTIINNQKTEIDLLRQVLSKEDKMADTLDEITADVAQETTLEGSLVTLLNGIAAQLAAAGQDPAKLSALHTQLTTNISNLTAAITANTPAAPAP